MTKPKRYTDKVFVARVKARDNYRCLKCGGHRCLEVHHIVPVYKGGPETESNAITLCHSCHKTAPNDPIAFFKYCSVHLPHSLAKSREFAKTILLLLRFKHPKLLADPSNEAQVKLEAIVDEFATDIWNVMYSGETDEFANLMRKYSWLKETDNEDDANAIEDVENRT